MVSAPSMNRDEMYIHLADRTLENHNQNHVHHNDKDINYNDTDGNSCMDGRICDIYESNLPFRSTVAGNFEQHRKCTDPLCLLLFLLAIALDLALFGFAFEQDSDPRYLYKGYNFDGHLCDDFTAWFNVSYPNITRCVKSCREINKDTEYDAVEFERHWCLPNPDNAAYKDTLYNKDSDAFFLADTSNIYARSIADLLTGWKSVFVVCLLSIVTSIIYLYMISINRRYWSYIVMNIGFGLVAGAMLLAHAVHDITDPLTDASGWLEVILAGIFLLTAMVMALYFFIYRELLRTKIELMAEAIQAVKQLYAIGLLCIIFAFCVILFVVYWISAALVMYAVIDKSYGDIPPILITEYPSIIGSATEYVVISTAPYTYSIVFHFLFALYFVFVFCYFGYLIICHTVMAWYLGKDIPRGGRYRCCCCRGSSSQRAHSAHIVCESFGTVFKYHVGTASFAAMVIPQLEAFALIKRYFMQIKGSCATSCGGCKGLGETEKSREDSVKEFSGKIEEMNKEDPNLYEKQPDVDQDARSRSVSSLKEQEKEHEKKVVEDMYNAAKERVLPLIEQHIIDVMRTQKKTGLLVSEQMNGIIRGMHADLKQEENEDGGHQEEENKAGDDTPSTIVQRIEKRVHDYDLEKVFKSDIKKFIEAMVAAENPQMANPTDDDETHEEPDQAVAYKRGKKLAGCEPKKMRKQGLVFTALYGTSLSYSSYTSSRLEADNATRLNVDGYNEYNEFFARVGIATVNSALIIIWMTVIEDVMNPDYNVITSFCMPVFVVFVTSYCVAFFFTVILEATVNSLLFCVMLNEEQWNKKFPINQAKIKHSVATLGSGLSAMLAEHLLIMQLKEKEVNKQIHDMSHIPKVRRQLKDAKIAALTTERALLESIDGPMKLTEYLINVILVENYFNSKYKSEKSKQESARKQVLPGCEHTTADALIKRYGHKTVPKKVVKEMMKLKVLEHGTVENFLSYFPVEEKKDDSQEGANKLERAWKRKIKNTVAFLQKTKGFKFKLSGASQKGIERGFYKSFYAYGSEKDAGYLYITDILRCSFVFKDFDTLYRCFAAIIVEMKGDYKILRVKDRFHKTQEPYGYRDLMINVMVEGEPDIAGMICEIQLHHELFYNAKKTSHKMYKRTRLFEREGTENEAYVFAKKYVRPIIGRFKVHQQEQTDSKDLVQVLQPKIKVLIEQFYNEALN